MDTRTLARPGTAACALLLLVFVHAGASISDLAANTRISAAGECCHRAPQVASAGLTGDLLGGHPINISMRVLGQVCAVRKEVCTVHRTGLCHLAASLA